MNNWIFYSILGAAIGTVTNFLDKCILESKIKDYRGMVMYSAIVGLIVGTILWAITGFPILNLKDGLLVVLTGLLSVWAAAIYFQVMQQEPASKVIFFFQLIPVFALLLSFLLLGESISLKQLLGFSIILISVLAVSRNGSEKISLKVDKFILLMMAVDVLWASGQVIFKFVSDTSSFVKLAAYESFGWALGGGLLFVAFPQVRNAFIKTTRSLGKLTLGVIFGNEIIFLTSKLLSFLAITIGPVALVSVLGGTNMFFGIIYGWILTLIAPKIFGEDISKTGLLKKFAWGSLMFMGIWLIY